MPHAKLSSEERVAFAAALKKMGLDRADTLSTDLSDMDDSDVPITLSDLSTAIPERLRKHIVNLSKQRHAMLAELSAVLDNLAGFSEELVEKMEATQRAKEPHCEMCGHLLMKTRKR
jgi:hypothetical protein